jgi:hypothetical protein
MPLPLNPYIAGNPVGDGPAFIGRADILRKVSQELRGPKQNAIMLYGQRRIGKTSVLQQLQVQLRAEGGYRPIYFDLQDNSSNALGQMVVELARSIAHELELAEPDLGDDADEFFQKEWLPKALEKLPDSQSLVLLFDEFDVLAAPNEDQSERAGAAFFPYLRELIACNPERLNFVFVIGRNVADLTSIAMSVFKAVPSRRVSLLDHDDTAQLVRLAEKSGTLIWSDSAVERIWQYTSGHPYLTQQLCSHVWERAYEEEPETPPEQSSDDVEAAVDDTLEASRNMLEWLWNGLGPAERVITSALAEAGPKPIGESELEKLLREHGVRILIRELQDAPRLLQEWDWV